MDYIEDLTKYNKNFFDVIKERFSCRDFTAEKINREELNIILESARMAPSAVNFQPVKLMVIEDEKILEKLKEATRFTFNARTIICVMHDKNISWHRKNDGKDHGIIDSSIAATYMMLSCTALGLGCCYVSAFKDNILREILNIADNYEINCLLPLGYPKEIKEHGARKNLEEFLIG